MRSGTEAPRTVSAGNDTTGQARKPPAISGARTVPSGGGMPPSKHSWETIDRGRATSRTTGTVRVPSFPATVSLNAGEANSGNVRPTSPSVRDDGPDATSR
ncbi:hypothetical protein [Myxococcus faecalis]|uniref:hypothetical protein n=1 Tax=Myxococcus faecalis TaxID=3115646 RepID=UPI003CF6F825